MTRRPTRRGLVATLVVVLASTGRAHAGDAEPDPDDEARAYARAVADGVPVAEAAAQVGADPWLVADALLRRGDAVAAETFARVWQDLAPVNARLLPYVVAPPPASRGEAGHDEVRRARTLLRDGSPEAAAAVLAASAAPDGTILAAERAWLRARALADGGRSDEAARVASAAADAAEALGWVVRAAAALRLAGNAFRAAYDPAAARHVWERRVALLRAFGTEDGVARALNDAAVAAHDASDFAGAVALLEEALAIRERIGADVDVAELLTHLATAECGRGRFARAFQLLDRAGGLVGDGTAAARPDAAHAPPVAPRRRLSVAAWTAHGRGLVALQCGRLAEAQAALVDAVEAARRVEDDELRGVALGNLAIAEALRGDPEAAERTHREALAVFQARKDTPRIAQVLANLADLRSDAGRHEEAIALQEQALAQIVATGDPLTAARTRGSIGTLRRRAGQPRRALDDHEAARQQAAAVGATFVEAEQWVGLAAARLDLGEDAAAVDAAQRALDGFRTFAFGAGDAVGISLQEAYDELFEVGALAAARLDDAARTARLLETGRGAHLQSALGGRDALAVVAAPPALVAEERAARAAETSALAAWLERVRAGVRDPAGRARWVQARDRAVAVVERIQREQARAAHLVYRAPVDPEAVAAGLGAGDAFVWYGVFPRGVVAVVARPGRLRIVPLPTTAGALADAVERVVEGDGSGATADALAALRALAVDALALEPAVRRVFVCPAGALAYAPMGALLPGRTVVLVPSATALALLARDATKRGHGVLAVGDPTYDSTANGSAVQLMRGALRLTPLPATREEASAVADGVPPLLGPEATEAGLRTALADAVGRLRAVHLACHGLVDRDQPLHSSLALTAAGDDDGFLTGAEVLRMHVDAELVVLSACSSGLGRVARGEGMLGLTRAFMFAGAPRVVASLWKVDDAATKALMLQFYARWRPQDGSKALPPAEALREAQAFVRRQRRWEHPRYWAAWVLWGVAD